MKVWDGNPRYTEKGNANERPEENGFITYLSASCMIKHEVTPFSDRRTGETGWKTTHCRSCAYILQGDWILGSGYLTGRDGDWKVKLKDYSERAIWVRMAHPGSARMFQGQTASATEGVVGDITTDIAGLATVPQSCKLPFSEKISKIG